MSSSDTWCSPHAVGNGVQEFFKGPVACDPCSNKRSIIVARVAYTFGGLIKPWLETDYENPPYSTTDVWTIKAIHEMRIGNIDELVRLVMVSTSCVWWRQQCGVEPLILPGGKEHFTRNPRIAFTKRLKFIGDNTSSDVKLTKKHGARFDTALVYYGRRERAFDKAFSHLTKWSTYGRATRRP